MKDEKLTNREELEQNSKEIQDSNLSSESLDMSELEGVEGGSQESVGCSAVFSGGCSSGVHRLQQDKND